MASISIIAAACGGPAASPARSPGGGTSPAASPGGGTPATSAGGGTSPSAAATQGGTGSSPAATQGGTGASPAGTQGGAGSPLGSPGAGLPQNLGGTVTVIGSWTGAEQQSFEAMVAPFEQITGTDVQYTGTRDLNAILGSGNFPDLAGLPGPGAMASFAEAGNLKPLDGVIDVNSYRTNTPAGFADIGVTNNQLYGVFIKSAVKGLIWYNPKNYTGGPPASFEALQATDKGNAQSLWCIGVESGATTGWPGTDWIEDIMLRQSGPDAYDRWARGELKWTSPEVKRAYETFGQAVTNTYGGPREINGRNFGEAGNPLFTNPPGCLFHHQASFITDFFTKAPGSPKAGTDFDFFPFPDIDPQYAGSVTGGGDLFGMFKDTPQAKALIAYLVTPEAQAIWVGRGGALSGDRRVTNYPDDASRKSAQILASAQTFRFDASDLMPGPMGEAFNRSIVEFVTDQSQLDTILGRLDQAQADAYGE